MYENGNSIGNFFSFYMFIVIGTWLYNFKDDYFL